MSTVLTPPSTVEAWEPDQASESDLDTPWLLVVYDDPVNTMSYVTMVFEKVLSLPRAVAEKKMWEVHTKGKSIVWNGSRERAEVFLQQIHLYGLQARIEKVE